MVPQPPAQDHLRKLQHEIESFLSAHDSAGVFEQGSKLFDLAASQWRLEIQFGKLLLEIWNASRSVVRRVEGLVESGDGRMSLLVWKPKALEPSTLELRDAECLDAASARELTGSAARRALFRRELAALIEREYPGVRVERVSNRSDREHVFSAWYARGWARQGPQAWAFLGLGPDEHPAAADAALAYGLIWLDWLRGQSERVTVPTLRLFLPPGAVPLSAHRAVYLNRQRLEIEIFAWSPGRTTPERIDLQDFGNVDTRLTSRRVRDECLARYAPLLRDLLGRDLERFDLVPDTSGNGVSLRVLGLTVARVDGQAGPQVHFGLEGNCQRLDRGREADFFRFVNQALNLRRADSPDPSHGLYRAQAERWLESLLVRDLTKVDPALLPGYVYPQVPAFSGPANPAMSRGVIDILGVTRGASGEGHRLAVVELKLHEEINLPLQGLDYWLRVKWLHERGQLQEFGYFPGLKLDEAPPRLYVVSPAFRFHSTTGEIIRYFDPSVEVIQVGLNDRWREGIQVLFRRVIQDADSTPTKCKFSPS